MKTIHILDRSGDTQITVETDIDFAQQFFDEAIANGKLVFGEIEGVKTVMRTFAPNVDRMVITPRFVGG